MQLVQKPDIMVLKASLFASSFNTVGPFSAVLFYKDGIREEEKKELERRWKTFLGFSLKGP
jgi:hypothetical protein